MENENALKCGHSPEDLFGAFSDNIVCNKCLFRYEIVEGKYVESTNQGSLDRHKE